MRYEGTPSPKQERPQTVEQGENSIGALVRAYSKLSTFKKLALAAALAGTEYGYAKTVEHYAPDAFRAHPNQAPNQQGEASPDRHQPTAVDERFESQGVHPLVMRQGLDRMFGREMINENIRQIEYSPDHIRMPSHYHGSSPFEAGHCTRSPLPGERSTIVLTVDTFQQSASPSPASETNTVSSEGGASTPYDAEEIGAVLIHEVAHALSVESAEGMPPQIRTRLRGALQAIVAGSNQSVYEYVNNYDHHGDAPGDTSQEDNVQQEELFAEMISDIGRWEPLPASSPLRMRPIAEQVTSRFALKHNLTLEQARPYGAVYAAVADWRGNAFFEQMQTGYQGMRQQIRQDIAQEMSARSGRRVQTALEGLAFPSLSVGVQRWAETWGTMPEGVNSSSNHEAVERIYDLEDDLIEEGSGNGQELHQGLELPKPLYARAKAMADRLRADRVTYDVGFVSRLGHPELIPLFQDVTQQLKTMRNHLRTVDVAMRGGMRSADMTPALIENDVRMINQKLAVLDGIEGLTASQRTQFQEAVLRWMEGERNGRWYAGIADRIPEMYRLYSDIVDEESEYNEREGIHY